MISGVKGNASVVAWLSGIKCESGYQYEGKRYTSGFAFTASWCARTDIRRGNMCLKPCKKEMFLNPVNDVLKLKLGLKLERLFISCSGF